MKRDRAFWSSRATLHRPASANHWKTTEHWRMSECFGLQVTGEPLAAAIVGGIWKGGYAGTVWRPAFDGQPVAPACTLEVASSDLNVIYMRSGETDIRSDLASGDGVYKSTGDRAAWINSELSAGPSTRYRSAERNHGNESRTALRK